jgi:hypothetical protein
MNKIPKKIYQSWKTKELDPKMSQLVDETKKLNPEYEYELYDNKDCADFIFKHFGQSYLNAFDVLIPGAFKCDFWRYCILYIQGGVYMDIDMVPLIPFREIISENDEFVSIVDFKHSLVPRCGIFQAFIAVVPKHPILLYALQLSFANIVTRRVEIDNFSVAGPVVMGIAVNLNWNKKVTHSSIEPGIYGNIKLLKMKGYHTLDLNNKQVFQNKFDGYERGSGNYAISSHYKDDPRRNNRYKMRNIKIFVVSILVLIIIVILIKFRKCKKTCSK